MAKILFNFKLAALNDAAVSVNDRSFRYGDGVFETIPVHAGLPYLWAYHMKRLMNGIHALSIHHNFPDLLPHALGLIRADSMTEGLIRIHISRGKGSQGYLPSPFPNPEPTVIIQTMERPAPLAKPINLWLSSYEKISPRALPTHCKTAQGLNSTLARMEAAEHDCPEALQLTLGDVIAEASSANIFWRKGGTLYTPSLATGALAGVTRQRMMDLSPYTICEGVFPLSDLEQADAVMLTNAATGATAVAELLPRATRWESGMLASEFNALRNNDIKHDTIALRESLAQR